MTRIARAILFVVFLSIASCQAQSPEVLACETVDEILAGFGGEDLERYVTSTEVFAAQVADVDDQFLRDVGTSLYIVALQWRESGFEDEQMHQANLLGVDLLGSRCEELRG